MLTATKQEIRLVKGVSEEDFLTAIAGNLVKVTFGIPAKWMVYEGRADDKKESFIEQYVDSKDNPMQIISHRSALQNLQFDQDGVIFSHLYHNIVLYDITNPRYEIAKEMLKAARKWQEFEPVKIWRLKK